MFVEKFMESELQQTILKLMREKPSISAKSIAEQVGMSSRGVQKRRMIDYTANFLRSNLIYVAIGIVAAAFAVFGVYTF